MKICKVFEAKELENALEEKGLDENMLHDFFDSVCNDTAARWWVEEPDSESDFENIINEYMISQGCALDEEVFIYFSW